jgi:hypothetical protein
MSLAKVASTKKVVNAKMALEREIKRGAMGFRITRWRSSGNLRQRHANLGHRLPGKPANTVSFTSQNQGHGF